MLLPPIITTIGFLPGQQAGGAAVSGGLRAAAVVAQSNLEEWGRADEGERMAFTLRLGNPVSQAVRLRYATSVTTATGSASVDDFTGVTSATMTFAANERQATAYVQTTEDHVAEGDETFTIRFEEHPAHPLPPGVSLPGGGLAALGRIVDDDVRGVTVSPRELLLFETGKTTAAYAVRLATQPSTGVTVTPSSSAAGTATVAPASLSFGTGDWSTAQKVTVTAVADAATGDRTVTVSHAVSGYGTGNEAVTTGPAVAVTVVDDDAAGVTVTPTALSMVEGGTGRYRVVLRTAPTSAVTVTVASSSGTVATASPGSLSFGTSDWSDAKTVTVTGAADDGDVNGTRQATLTHTVSGYGAVTTAAQVAVTVTDDDQAGLTIEPLSLTLAEGAAKTYRVRLNYRPTTTTAVTVTPSVDGTLATVAPATLNYTQTTWRRVADGDGDGAGERRGDRRPERAGDARGRRRVRGRTPAVALTITDDDTAGLLVDTGQTSGAVPVPETGSVTWQVSLTSEPSTTTAVTRTAGDADLTASPDRLLFTAGDWSTTKTVTVRAATDADATDGSATFTVRASGYAADAVVVTVVEEDHTPLLAIAAPGAVMTVDETTGSSELRFPVTLTRAAADPGDEVRVAYQSSDGAAPCPHPDLNLPAATTGTAVAGSDYTLTSGTLTFAARSTTATGTTTQTQVVKVPVLRTIDDEASYECLTMELGNAVKAALGRSATSGVIVDGDFPRVVSIAGTTVGEPLRARSTTATFTVNLDVARSAAETTVEWRTEAGSATAGSDFVAAEGTVTFQRGEIDQTIDVTVLDDGAVEREETFRVVLSNPSANTSVGVSSATGTIVSDDVPEVQVADVTVTESALPTTATFTVRLSQPAALVMRVAYATSASTALAGRDYAAATGTLTFDVGDDERTIGVAVLDDGESEADETFALNLFWGDDVLPDPVAQATATVYDDDRPGVPRGEVEVIEPDAGQTSATFVVRLEEPAVRELEYAWATADGTAEAGSDYTEASGRLTFRGRGDDADGDGSGAGGRRTGSGRDVRADAVAGGPVHRRTGGGTGVPAAGSDPGQRPAGDRSRGRRGGRTVRRAGGVRGVRGAVGGGGEAAAGVRLGDGGRHGGSGPGLHRGERYDHVCGRRCGADGRGGGAGRRRTGSGRDLPAGSDTGDHVCGRRCGADGRGGGAGRRRTGSGRDLPAGSDTGESGPGDGRRGGVGHRHDPGRRH